MALKTTAPPKKQTLAIAANVFAGQMEKPTQKAVEAALGASYALWKQLISELKKELHLDGEDWHSSGVKYGWALRLQKKDRNNRLSRPAQRTVSGLVCFGRQGRGDRAKQPVGVTLAQDDW
jgi:Protein of unknown function (DUF3788)